MSSRIPSRLVICVGTYEGVLAGWESSSAASDDDGGLKLTFATPVHEGSVRSLCLACSNDITSDFPGTLVSCGYDEMLKTHDWKKHINSSGEVRTPADFGTPTCSSFAPPNEAPSTHCMLGFSNGKIVLYKKRDWSVQHVLAGHEGGVASLAVHPTGKMALTGGQSDGKLKLWDLTKGRLAYVSKIPPSSMHQSQTRYDAVNSLVWSKDGSMYGFAHGQHITVRDVASGKELLDVDVPGRVNQITIMSGAEGTFAAAACNDGSLPVLAVQDVDHGEKDTRRAIMAIEPIDDPVAGEERFKCIQSVEGYLVVTANSAGVVSLMNLDGAVRMILTDQEDQDDGPETDPPDDDNASESGEEELAVDIIASVQLGTGARITCLTTWCQPTIQGEAKVDDFDEDIKAPLDERVENEEGVVEAQTETKGTKRKSADVAMDSDMVTKARELVRQAKKLKKTKR
jgi:protein MAK11